jgi:nicotinate-nucleotide adenylyltransferase
MTVRLMSKCFGSLAARLPLATPGQRIGLLGGSFNPPHRTHAAISETVMKRLALDQVWWLVSPGNPLKSHSNLSPLAERIAAARALAPDPRIKVTGFEAELGSAATVVTLRFLRRRYPGVRFVWIMGGDNLAGLHRWAQWRRIAAEMPFVVADRPGWRLKALASPAARFLARARLDERDAASLPGRQPPAWAYLGLRLSDESSSRIRAEKRAPGANSRE